MIRQGYVTGPVLGGLWMIVLSVTVAVAMSFGTGEAFRPGILLSLLWGGVAGGVMVAFGRGRLVQAGLFAALVAGVSAGIGPILVGSDTSGFAKVVGAIRWPRLS